MCIVVTTPNFKFGKDLKKSAPAGISVHVGQQVCSPDADPPAMALVVFNTVKPRKVSREGFVAWLLGETAKDERFTLSYNGVDVEKQASALGRIFDHMEEHKNDKPSPEDEA